MRLSHSINNRHHKFPQLLAFLPYSKSNKNSTSDHVISLVAWIVPKFEVWCFITSYIFNLATPISTNGFHVCIWAYITLPTRRTHDKSNFQSYWKYCGNLKVTKTLIFYKIIPKLLIAIQARCCCCCSYDFFGIKLLFLHNSHSSLWMRSFIQLHFNDYVGYHVVLAFNLGTWLLEHRTCGSKIVLSSSDIKSDLLIISPYVRNIALAWGLSTSLTRHLTGPISLTLLFLFILAPVPQLLLPTSPLLPPSKTMPMICTYNALWRHSCTSFTRHLSLQHQKLSEPQRKIGKMVSLNCAVK